MDRPQSDRLKAEAIRKRVADAIEKQRLNMAEISRDIGMNGTYVQQYVSGKGPEFLKPKVAEKLAPFLGIPASELVVSKGTSPKREFLAGPPVGDEENWPVDVPIYGTTRGGSGGDFEMNRGDISETMERPPYLKIRNLFGLRVDGDSLRPAVNPGDRVICAEGQPVTPGDLVVIEMYPEEDGGATPAYIKYLVRRDADKIVVEQLNPRKNIPFRTKDVKAIHFVASIVRR